MKTLVERGGLIVVLSGRKIAQYIEIKLARNSIAQLKYAKRNR